MHPEISVIGSLITSWTFCWIKEAQEFSKLRRLTFRLARPSEQQNPIITGMASTYIKRYWEPIRGCPESFQDYMREYLKKLDQQPEMETDPDLVHFEIDGEGGERIVTLGVDSADRPQALMVKISLLRLLFAFD